MTIDWREFLTLSAVLATVAGWFVTQILNRRREDRTRKLENLLRHYQKQTEEFYGPLFNLVHQIFLVNETQSEITEARNGRLTEEQKEKVSAWFLERHFSKLHAEVNEILKTKLYLVEGSEMPKSFYEYLRHSYQERDQHGIYTDLRIDTRFLPGRPWPQEFYDDIKNGFERAMGNYEAILDGLRDHKRGLFRGERGFSKKGYPLTFHTLPL
jgi:hypothetical protein